MTDVQFGLLLAGAAVIGMAVALHRQHALGRAGLVTVTAAVTVTVAVLFLT